MARRRPSLAVRERKIAFPPIIGGRPRVLILGSMPGDASLRLGEYYGHRRNAFWAIMTDLLGLPADADYRQRTAALVAGGIALWDVLAACERDGSLDAAIRPESIQVNDFHWLFADYPGIELIVFNGGTAEREYHKRVRPGLMPADQAIPMRRLPSTSPAYAGMPLAEKMSVWCTALAELLRQP